MPSQISSRMRACSSTMMRILAAWLRLAQQRHFVERERVVRFAIALVPRFMRKRMNLRGFGGIEAFFQAGVPEFVHQEADRTQIHAVDRFALPRNL
jgi:hypothetical protein